MVYELAVTLPGQRAVPTGLYRRADELRKTPFRGHSPAEREGHRTVHLLFLAGCYVTVCPLLSTFEVPIPDIGVDE